MEDLKEVRRDLALAFVLRDWHAVVLVLDMVRALMDEKPCGKHFAKEEVPW